jgi:actin-related protein
MELRSSRILVIDVGSRITKAGFAGDEEPSLVLPTMIVK